MKWCYNLVLMLLFVVAGPPVLMAALFSKKRRGTISRRLGLQKFPDYRRLEKDRPIWVHALSVGEVLSAVELTARLKTEFPGRPIVFSATTRTGIDTARNRLAGIADDIVYFCYDLPFSVAGMVARINPGLVVVVESDIWPNFLWALEKRYVPVVLVNGRLSEKSFAGYRRFSWVMGPVFNTFSVICAQTREDADRFAALGVAEEKTVVTGSIKFDRPAPSLSSDQKLDLRHCLGIESDARILVAGSTHPGEEEVLARALADVRKAFEHLVLVAAPRDPARSGDVAAIFGGPDAGAFTLTGVGRPDRSGPVRVVVIDRIGLLDDLYAVADIAVIGGSFLNLRGHNPLEPAACGVPVLFGPHMEDFAEIARLLIDGGGALQIEDTKDLGPVITDLLTDRDRRRHMGRAAFQVFESNRGALDRVMTVCHIAEKKPPPARTVTGGADMLMPLSFLYGGVARLRRSLYTKGFMRPRQLPCPVISVGNITVGGTGKTPMTIYLAKLLVRMGWAPMIVSRGYRGSASTTGGLVSDHRRVRMDVGRAGDEPFMMAQSLPGVPVVVGKKRYRATTAAMADLSTDAVILDDGFQHFQLARNLDIVLLDSTRPLGNGKLLPAGPLREPLSCLARAHAFVFTRSDPAADLRLEPAILPYLKEKPVFRAFHRPVLDGWGRVGEDAMAPDPSADATVLKDLPVFVFCGLAKNNEFLKSVRQTGARVAGHLFFRDHHAYTDEDLSVITGRALAAGAKTVVTSKKDYVKIAGRVGMPGIDLAVLGVEIDFGPDRKRFESFVAASLGIKGGSCPRR